MLLGWLGYFVGCESEAMYHIYSLEKHKVYRIGVARVEDGERLDDLHAAPCLEDIISTENIEVPDELISEIDDRNSCDDDEDDEDDEDGHPIPTEPNPSESEPSPVEDILQLVSPLLYHHVLPGAASN